MSFKFDGEIESLEKYLIEFYKNDLTDQIPQNQLIISELQNLVIKGIMSKGFLDYLTKEGINSSNFSKLEQDINEICSKIEDTLNLEVFGCIEHISFFLSKLLGLSRQVEIEFVFGLKTSEILNLLEISNLMNLKYEDLFLKISDAKLNIKNYFVFLNNMCIKY